LLELAKKKKQEQIARKLSRGSEENIDTKKAVKKEEPKKDAKKEVKVDPKKTAPVKRGTKSC